MREARNTKAAGTLLPMLRSPEKAASAAAISIATGAVLCGVYCALPFALPAVMLATSGSIIAWFAHAYSWARIAAIIIVTLAWLWVGVRSVGAKAWPARSTLYATGVATCALVFALAWPRIEPIVIRFLKS